MKWLKKIHIYHKRIKQGTLLLIEYLAILILKEVWMTKPSGAI